MFDLEKRVFWPSFFISVGIIFSLAVAGSHDYLGFCIGLSLLLIAWVINSRIDFRRTILDYSIYFFILTLILNLFILNPAISPLAYFITSYFLLGFLVFYNVEKILLKNIYHVIILIFSFLAVWAFIQFIFGLGQISHNSYRASVIFANPNTYAAAINLILLPLICIHLLNDSFKSKYLYVVNIILFASLITTQSRGAGLAFLISCVCLFIFSRIAKITFIKNRFRNLLFGFLVVLAFLSGMKLIVGINNDADPAEVKNVEVLKDNVKYIFPYKLKSSISHRQELNKVAWKNIKENSIIGIGFLNFVYFNYRDTVNYIYGKSFYVHNDYLQLWLELGFFGIFAFLFLIVTVYWQGINFLRKGDKENKFWVILILCALTTFFMHALLSYLFYTPVITFFMAAYLAVLSNLISNKTLINKLQNNLENKKLLIKLMFSLIITVFLFSHAAAQISARAGISMLKENKVDIASELFAVARRLSPHVSDNYLIEANVWKNIAINNNDRIAANTADSLYSSAMIQSPYDMESRLYRAMLHRDAASLLNIPVSSETIVEWLEYALAWRPHHHKIQAEYLRTLVKYGRIEQARLLLSDYIKKYPDSRLLKKVNNEFLILNYSNKNE